MAQTFTGRTDGGRTWPLLVLGVVELFVAGPMLAMLVMTGLVAGVMGLASGSSAVVVLGLALLLALGPLLGLGLGFLLVRVFELRREPGAFPLISFGLLAGTAIEYLCWIRPAIG
ncbi:hypothetical protein [Kitasatospora aureofaciens]|uniref:hypothetical protein n=1 Tax=Kitasatospora aureofaciens TaxID=1894 RepID=UPI001C43D3AC|nr:hypothetical protein [Kitasatospora aureofaciens]MBV6699613.1 hypothetical protein [Kitasatospora aureofaciens]